MMYWSSKPVLKTFKTFKTLRHVSISYEIILREFVISLLKLLILKCTKNVKDPLWLCDNIRQVCLHCVLHGAVSWTAVQLTNLHSTQCRYTRRMLPHNHNGSLTFLANFKLSNLNKEIKNSLKMNL